MLNCGINYHKISDAIDEVSYKPCRNNRVRLQISFENRAYREILGNLDRLVRRRLGEINVQITETHTQSSYCHYMPYVNT